MKKIFLFDNPPKENFKGYHIESIDASKYLGVLRRRSTVLEYLMGRRTKSWVNPLGHADEVDRLYRQRDPDYMRLVGDVVDRYRDYDAIIMASYNFLHPEILAHELKKPVKVMGFVDDPMSTYTRGVQYLWAFDGAFYISPSYSAQMTMPQALERWGCKRNMWFPLGPRGLRQEEPTEDFFASRKVDLAYVGSISDSKVDRLASLRRHFGGRMRVHGRWPHRGYFGITRALTGKPLFPSRVSPLSEREKNLLFRDTKIGINMHVSDRPAETGNVRMYEVPAHGMMLLCDESARSAHELIFKPGVEAVFFSTMEDAIEKAEYYLSHDEERVSIARAGYERFWRDYAGEAVMSQLLDWAVSLPKRQTTDMRRMS